jgi:hypothetical protein
LPTSEGWLRSFNLIMVRISGTLTMDKGAPSGSFAWSSQFIALEASPKAEPGDRLCAPTCSAYARFLAFSAGTRLIGNDSNGSIWSVRKARAERPLFALTGRLETTISRRRGSRPWTAQLADGRHSQTDPSKRQIRDSDVACAECVPGAAMADG